MIFSLLFLQLTGLNVFIEPLPLFAFLMREYCKVSSWKLEGLSKFAEQLSYLQYCHGNTDWRTVGKSFFPFHLLCINIFKTNPLASSEEGRVTNKIIKLLRNLITFPVLRSLSLQTSASTSTRSPSTSLSEQSAASGMTSLTNISQCESITNNRVCSDCSKCVSSTQRTISLTPPL